MLTLWDGNNTSDFGVMTRDQVRAFDRWAIDEIRIPGIVLMENAGRTCAHCLIGEMKETGGAGAVLFCGSGNNGGDGYVIARHLAIRGLRPAVVLAADPKRISGDALTNLRILQGMKVPVYSLEGTAECRFNRIKNLCREADWLVDAFLGTGLKGTLSEEAAELICAMNSQNRPLFSVDIPSGLDCDSGFPLPVCVQARCTVTLAALKKGFVDNPESKKATGRIFVASIGITPEFMSGA